MTIASNFERRSPAAMASADTEVDSLVDSLYYVGLSMT
jgi:hypothetical protein